MEKENHSSMLMRKDVKEDATQLLDAVLSKRCHSTRSMYWNMHPNKTKTHTTLTTTGISFATCNTSLPSMILFFNSVRFKFNKLVNIA